MPFVNGKEVGEIGHGLMGFTWKGEPAEPEEVVPVVDAAIANGATFLNGGEIYGSPDYNSTHLLRDYLKLRPDAADKFVINIKGGFRKHEFVPDSSEQNLRRSVDDCNAALEGRKKIDIFECARVDPTRPIEEIIGILARFKEEGKIGGIGLSAVDAETIRRAHKVHPIAAVEVELSLVKKDILTNGVAQTCVELGIPICAYFPLGAGILSGRISERTALPPGDIRLCLPAFEDKILQGIQQMVAKLNAFATKRNMTTAQLLLTWIRTLSARDGMPVIIPIPGSTAVNRVQENSTLMPLFSDAEMKELDDLVNSTPIPEGFLDF